MDHITKLISKNILAFLLCYITYNALYMFVLLVIYNLPSPRSWWENYVLLLSQSFIIMIIPVVLLVVVFNLIVLIIKDRLYTYSRIKLTLLGGLLGVLGYFLIHVIVSTNVWIVDSPTLTVLAGFCFGFYYSLLFPKPEKVRKPA